MITKRKTISRLKKSSNGPCYTSMMLTWSSTEDGVSFGSVGGPECFTWAEPCFFGFSFKEYRSTLQGSGLCLEMIIVFGSRCVIFGLFATWWCQYLRWVCITCGTCACFLPSKDPKVGKSLCTDPTYTSWQYMSSIFNHILTFLTTYFSGAFTKDTSNTPLPRCLPLRWMNVRAWLQAVWTTTSIGCLFPGFEVCWGSDKSSDLENGYFTRYSLIVQVHWFVLWLLWFDYFKKLYKDLL